MTDQDQELLAERIRALSSPLAPAPTGVSPRLPSLTDVRAVLFDVYGTLFVSGSGDISTADPQSKAGMAAQALVACGFVTPSGAEVAGERFCRLFLKTIEADHARLRDEGVACPEVDIRDVMRRVLESLRGEGMVRGEITMTAAAQCAVEYECRVNPVWPMPGARDVVDGLRSRGVVLGIVSNAQFFTPILFEALLGVGVQELGFDPALCLWSWQMLEAKPGARMFERARGPLAQNHIAPEQAIYVGNDMLNDMLPAARAGFRTALFAGDARSLRLRADDPRCAGVTVDAVLTELPQLLHVLPGALPAD